MAQKKTGEVRQTMEINRKHVLDAQTHEQNCIHPVHLQRFLSHYEPRFPKSLVDLPGGSAVDMNPGLGIAEQVNDFDSAYLQIRYCSVGLAL